MYLHRGADLCRQTLQSAAPGASPGFDSRVSVEPDGFSIRVIYSLMTRFRPDNVDSGRAAAECVLISLLLSERHGGRGGCTAYVSVCVSVCVCVDKG